LSIVVAFVDSSVAIVASMLRCERAPPREPSAAFNRPLERKEEEMTADKFRTLSSWVAAAFISMLMLTAAATSHPVLI
jgi:hypothetical protein